MLDPEYAGGRDGNGDAAITARFAELSIGTDPLSCCTSTALTSPRFAIVNVR
jgi:hypothetical protein